MDASIGGQESVISCADYAGRVFIILFSVFELERKTHIIVGPSSCLARALARLLLVHAHGTAPSRTRRSTAGR
jgi:hypothetical protein